MVSTLSKLVAIAAVLASAIECAPIPTPFLPNGGGAPRSLLSDQRSSLAAFASAPAGAATENFDLGKVAKKVLASSKDFFLGAASGGVASLLVFPIDLAKTRIQDQKVVAGAELVYKNAVQTIFKVATTEGFPALYNGVAPVLIGAAPESALQIGMNDKAKAYFAR
jgi:hypothetical protein